MAVPWIDVRQQLGELVHRRNKMAHEYDEDPANPPEKRPIGAGAATHAIDSIEQMAAAILVVLDQDSRLFKMGFESIPALFGGRWSVDPGLMQGRDMTDSR